MTQGTFLVPGPRGSLRVSTLNDGSHKRQNRRQHTLLWRIVCFAAGIVIGWVIHGLL